MTTDERVANLEGRMDALMETLANQMATLNERISDMSRRIDDLRSTTNTGFIVLGSLMAAQLAVLITIAFRAW
jgi:tetrahydromethanopterin S-methyltransferase subunit B